MTRSRGIIADRIAQRQIRVGLLAHNGMPPKQIAKELGCAVRTVRDDLEAMDMLPPRPPGRPRKEAP
ncbi:transcriptional regulator WhiB-like [Gordonia phage Denise]|uniref:Helix-turn-helix DNA binding domain protein n=1 Tax=Gordonia phage Denise TaxID=2652879 RepID=A0A5P8DCH2_9CAUD|nr:transcriptional regulator WhiB-like [Gordonia phage Denise]QFP96677.1 helix-turn-helix DNA binding domain protein [Gordonia phage Denise]